MARQIGSDYVIDYTKDNFSRNGQHYDLILAVNGNHPILDYRRALSPNGIYVAVGGSTVQIVLGLFLVPTLDRTSTMKMGVIRLIYYIMYTVVLLGNSIVRS